MRELMNATLVLLAVIALLFTANDAAAQDEAKPDDKELRAELAEAQKQLNEAARRVGELTRELGEGFAFHFEEGTVPRSDRAIIGVVISETEDSDGEKSGLRIMSVSPGGPAQEAGLQSGDVIIGVDDLDIDGKDKKSSAFVEYMNGRTPGDEVTIRYRRDDDTGSATVKTTEAAPRAFGFRFGPDRDFEIRVPDPGMMPRPPRPPMAPLAFALRGPLGDVELVPVSEELGEYFEVDRGLLVVRAPKDGDLKLRDGDVILKIGDREPDEVGQALRILRSYDAGETVRLEIMRDGDRETLEITLPDRDFGLFEWRGGDGEHVLLRRHEVVKDGEGPE